MFIICNKNCNIVRDKYTSNISITLSINNGKGGGGGSCLYPVRFIKANNNNSKPLQQWFRVPHEEFNYAYALDNNIIINYTLGFRNS